MHRNRLVGTLDAYFETGTEGVLWSFLDNDKSGYAGLNVLKNGDYLFVEDGSGGIDWEGVVLLDIHKNKVPIPTNPEYYKQAVLGYWVHGLQHGVEPERWAKWFFESRPAVLIKGGLHGNAAAPRGE